MAKLRFRKSINLGGGVKINASRSGLGASVGVKGARIGRGADGKTRLTGGIPGTGLSAQHTFGQGRRAAPRPQLRGVPWWGWIVLVGLPVLLGLLRGLTG